MYKNLHCGCTGNWNVVKYGSTILKWKLYGYLTGKPAPQIGSVQQWTRRTVSYNASGRCWMDTYVAMVSANLQARPHGPCDLKRVPLGQIQGNPQIHWGSFPMISELWKFHHKKKHRHETVPTLRLQEFKNLLFSRVNPHLAIQAWPLCKKTFLLEDYFSWQHTKNPR